MLEYNAVYEKLADEMDCPAELARQLARQLLALPQDIYAAFETWFYTGKTNDFCVEGFTVDLLRAKRNNLTVPGAYLTLDWLRRDPQQAKRALEQPVFLGSAAGRRTVF